MVTVSISEGAGPAGELSSEQANTQAPKQARAGNFNRDAFMTSPWVETIPGARAWIWGIAPCFLGNRIHGNRQSGVRRIPVAKRPTGAVSLWGFWKEALGVRPGADLFRG